MHYSPFHVPNPKVLLLLQVRRHPRQIILASKILNSYSEAYQKCFVVFQLPLVVVCLLENGSHSKVSRRFPKIMVADQYVTMEHHLCGAWLEREDLVWDVLAILHVVKFMFSPLPDLCFGN